MNPKDKKPLDLKDHLIPMMGGLFMLSSLFISLFYFLDVNADDDAYSVPVFTFLWCGALFLMSLIVLARGLCLIGQTRGKEVRGLVTLESLAIYLTLLFHALQSRSYWNGYGGESSPLSPSTFFGLYTAVAAICFLGAVLLLVITLVPGYSERVRLGFIFWSNLLFTALFTAYAACAFASSSFAASAYFYLPCILCLGVAEVVCFLRCRELKKEEKGQ